VTDDWPLAADVRHARTFHSSTVDEDAIAGRRVGKYAHSGGGFEQ